MHPALALLQYLDIGSILVYVDSEIVEELAEGAVEGAHVNGVENTEFRS